MDKTILPPTFLTYTLGCRVNQAEMSAISSQLSAFSYQKFDQKRRLSPDLILINTCAVTLKAERESRKATRHFKRLYPKAKVIGIGCAADFVTDADLLIANKDKENSIEIIFKKFPNLILDAPRTVTLSLPKGLLRGEYLRQPFFSSGRALVKIQDGCDHFCSYCIVPLLRGKPKSIPPEEIICKINKLVKDEIKEITLCGINLNLYQPGVIDLLKKILKETSAERITLSSIEPDMVTKEFANLFVKESRLAKYFHLALQSGSQKVFKDMGRKTNLKELSVILHFIRLKCPEFTFRADILVGFPTETEKNFQETLDFIKENRIAFIHTFPFSVRPDTKVEGFIKSGKWQDLPTEVKKERVKKVTTLAEKIRLEEAKKLKGKILPSLIIKKIPGGYEALANNSWLVRVRSKKLEVRIKNIKGKILPLKIIGFENNYLLGTEF